MFGEFSTADVVQNVNDMRTDFTELHSLRNVLSQMIDIAEGKFGAATRQVHPLCTHHFPGIIGYARLCCADAMLV
eukprot:scaffold463553_cov45-Prasinocladus_malaysianus.AAC.2